MVLMNTLSLENNYVKDLFLAFSKANSEKANPSSPSGSQMYNLPITSSNSLPLGYRRLVEARLFVTD